MRPTGGMRLELGHEQAGLRDVLVPVRARLGIALLGLEVDVEQAVALVVAVGPGELILQRPHKVAVDVYAAVNRLEDPCEMLTPPVGRIRIPPRVRMRPFCFGSARAGRLSRSVTSSRDFRSYLLQIKTNERSELEDLDL